MTKNYFHKRLDRLHKIKNRLKKYTLLILTVSVLILQALSLFIALNQKRQEIYQYAATFPVPTPPVMPVFTCPSSCPTVTIAADGTGNYTTINAAVAALGSNGGKIILKPGTYAPATLTSNIWLDGAGATSIVKTPNGSQANAILVENVTNVKITHIYVDGNKANADVTGASYTTVNGIRIFNSNNVTVDSISGGNTYFGAISPDSSTNITITNNTISNTRDNGIFLRPNNNIVLIKGNTVSGATYSGIQCLRSDNVYITDNTTYNNGPSTTAEGDGIGSEGCCYTTIINNQIYSNGVQGVKVDYTSEGAATSQRSNYVSVVNNNIYNNNATINTSGIDILRSDNIQILCNIIIGNYYGINIGKVGATTIDNNKIYNSINIGVRSYDVTSAGPIEITNNDIQGSGYHQIETFVSSTKITGNRIHDGKATAIRLSAGSNFTVTGNIIGNNADNSIVIASGVTNVQQSNNTISAVFPVPPTATPTAVPVSTAGFITSIDAMKETKDNVNNNQPTHAQILADVAKMTEMNADYIAVSTPYDAAAYLTEWVQAIHAAGKKVYFRSHWNAWEGDDGVAATMTPSQYVSQLDQFIRNNPGIFKSGDIFDPCPELENGKYWQNQYGSNWITSQAAKDEFNNFIRNSTSTAENAFAVIGVTGIDAKFHSTNGWIAQAKEVLYDSTVAAMGRVVTDSYVAEAPTNTPDQVVAAYQQELNTIHNARSNVPVMLAEWGWSFSEVSDTQQQQVIRALINYFKSVPWLQGSNYWVGPGWASIPDGTRLFNGSPGNWIFRPAAYDIANWYGSLYPVRH